MALNTPINDVIGLQLASPYTAGSGSMVLRSGEGAKIAATPTLVTAITAATYQQGASEVKASYVVSGVSGDTLTVAVADGYADRNFAIGDYVECRPEAKYITDLNAAVNANTAALNGVPSGVLKGSAGALAAAVAGTDYLTPTGSGAGLTGYLARAIYIQTTNPAAITAAGATSIIGSGVGSATLPAGLLNAAGRTLRISARGYGTTAAASPGTIYAAILLGGSIVATSASTNQPAGRGPNVWTIDALITAKSAGSAGTIDTAGFLAGGYNGTSSLFSNPIDSIASGTTGGTPSPGTPATVNLTAALALDLQLALGSTVAGNSYFVTHVMVEVLA